MKDSGTRNQARCFVFAGGGSGGHLTPSIAVAEKLLVRDPQAELIFLTSGREVDHRVLEGSFVVADKRCAVVPLPLSQPPGLRWSGWRHAWALLRSTVRCRRIMKQRRPDAVLATGAFASVPGLKAAKWQRIPIVLFEANTAPGRVNRWCAGDAESLFCAWPDVQLAGGRRFLHSGMPVRSRLTSESASQPAAATTPRQILITGGSQGSRRLNELVRAELFQALLPAGWRILHQTGTQDAVESESGDRSRQVTTQSFIDDIPGEMRQSDIVVSRAGAVTLGELAAAGCPAVLVPLLSSADDHQRRNAQRLVQQGAAVMVRETDGDAAQQLRDQVLQLADDPSRRARMASCLRSLHQADAADTIARRLLDLADRSRHSVDR